MLLRKIMFTYVTGIKSQSHVSGKNERIADPLSSLRIVVLAASIATAGSAINSTASSPSAQGELYSGCHKIGNK